MVPEHSAFGYQLFVRYLRSYFRKHFHAVRTSHGELPPRDGRPLIVYSNHPSWWDPIHFSLLASFKFPDRRLYGPMDAEALKKYRFFKKLGVFGIDRSPRGAAAFLRTSLLILEQDSGNAHQPTAHPGTFPSLWLTAEGQFTDPRGRPVRIQPGVAHLARRLKDGWVVPLALEYPFWNERAPEALSRFGDPIDLATATESSTRDWTRRLEQSLEDTMNALANDVSGRNPQSFETLLAGRAGIGGVYDHWRRLKAGIRGRPFHAGHEDPTHRDTARGESSP